MLPASSHLEPGTTRFIVERYNDSAPFSSFLPGIAGKWGVPIWCFYVNRGQAVASLGVRDKDDQILEFQSFNQACMRIDREGFRTFLRLDTGEVYEPFACAPDPQNALGARDARTEQTMIIAPGELVLRERCPRLGLEIEVSYFGLPNLRVAGLVRVVRIRNTGKRKRRIDWVDGLPRILPYGLDQARIKGTPRHSEGMMGVVEHDGAAIYRIKQTADDSEQVGAIAGGHFYLRLGRHRSRGLVVDPQAVFGEPFSYSTQKRFAAGGTRAVLSVTQYFDNQTPSALSVQTNVIEPGAEVQLASVIGFSACDHDLDALIAQARRPGFVKEKREENRRLIEEIADHAFTVSASGEFDAYARQTFLDNVLRGGMPVVADSARGKTAFYVYSRQNGDLERDYHFFVLEPTYLSQGTGHYRSVLQNRRTDVWFFPETDDINLRTFLDLVQLDGYNPLEVRGQRYRVRDDVAARAWAERHGDGPRTRDALRELLQGGFSPGQLVMCLEDQIGLPPAQRTAILEEVLALSEPEEVGALHEGFWADHWHYNFDLLETWLMIYPDRVDELLLGRGGYVFFDDPDVIVPRAERACLVGSKVRAYGAVVRSPDKLERIARRSDRPYTARTGHGDGDVYETTLLVKLLAIIANRLCTLDAAGTGIEMEGGKPGWNDSLNGLPGLFGSGLPETLELARAIALLSSCLDRAKRARTRKVAVFKELCDLYQALLPAMQKRIASRSRRASLKYWREANDLKEAYRKQTEAGISGQELRIPLGEIAGFLRTGAELLERIFTGRARTRVLSREGVPLTYFVNEVTGYDPTGERNPLGYPTVHPRSFEQRPVKLFLEGPVHWMKHRRGEAKAVYDAVARSPLFDRKLHMYKCSENMQGESPELGRAIGAYPRGWIENESIYLHMEYKYLLEVLRAGLCEEFWRDARRALVPFLDPAVYGRSTLEGASFIVSSAYADPDLVGRAFQPRLSGITCEFLHIWLLAVAGEHPFSLDRAGRLQFGLEPRLPGWLFRTEPCRRAYHDASRGWIDLDFPGGCFAFKLLGHTLVVYENPDRKSTFGQGGARPRSYVLSYRSGRTARVTGEVVPERHARALRAGEIARVDVALRCPPD